MEYLIIHTPSGKGNKSAPTTVNPNDAELNILKSSGTKGRDTGVNTPGIVNSIVGAVGAVTYVEASATPNVRVLYVGITKNSNFNVGIALNNNARGQRLSSYPLA
jgi:hypothetical protein